MVHYNYDVKGWAIQNQKLLYALFRELLLDMNLMGESPRLGTVSDPNKPYIEIEDNERVRIRRVTHLSDTVLNDLLQKAGEIYNRVKDIQDDKIKEEFSKFIMRNQDRITHTDNEILHLQEQLKGTPFENYLGGDGKIPLAFELDNKAGKKLDRISHQMNKPQDEVVESMLKKHLNDVESGKICCFCNKKIIGMGNNPAPESDTGRCCDDCNTNRVIPARIANPEWRMKIENNQRLLKDVLTDDKSLMDALKQAGKMKYKKRLFTIFKENFDIEELYEFYKIPAEDRLKNFQVLTNFFKEGTDTRGKIEGASEIQKIANSLFYSEFVLPSINAPEEKRKAYYIGEDLAEKILNRKNYPETLLPFPVTIIDCALPVEDRFYIGFLCSKMYEDDPKFQDIPRTTVITCYIEKEGDTYNLAEEWIILENGAEKEYKVKDSKHIKKIKNFICGVLSFIHEPDVEIFDHPLNPRNNQRRMEKGRPPLPSYVTLRITGKKRIYLEKNNSLPPQPRNFMFQQDVKNTYIHFYNKTKYKRLYKLWDEDRQKAMDLDYEWYPPKQVLRKKKKGFTRFKDKPRRNVSYILEEDIDKDAIKINKQIVNKIREETK